MNDKKINNSNCATENKFNQIKHVMFLLVGWKLHSAYIRISSTVATNPKIYLSQNVVLTKPREILVQ